jgi:hypothetical protein
METMVRNLDVDCFNDLHLNNRNARDNIKKEIYKEGLFFKNRNTSKKK